MDKLKSTRCALVTTGGTIVSKVDPATGLALATLDGHDLVASLQSLGVETFADIEVHEVARVSSPFITPEHWVQMHNLIQALVKRDDIDGVIIAHGTATLEETAWFLDLTTKTDKPVIVIGAQRNTSDYDTDGPRNFFNAILLCKVPESRGKGVLVTLNNHINAAREVAKSHTVDVETFQSGEWGYLGSIVNTRVRFHRAPLRRLHLPFANKPLPKIDVICMYAGAGSEYLDMAADLGAKGVVVQAIASGHLNRPMYQGVVRLINQGIPVVISTRIPRGGTRSGYGFEGSSQSLVEAGAVLSSDLSPWKARILLMLALQNDMSTQTQLTELFDY